MKHLSFLTPLFSAFLFTLLSCFPATIMAQNYWDQIPAFTSQCYSEQDPYRNTVDDLRFEIKDKIEAIKQADSEKANNMTEKEMMAVAMRHQNMTTAEIVNFQEEMAEMTTAQADFFEKVTAIENRYNELESEFRKEFGARLGPIEKESRELPDGEGTPQWAIDRAEELIVQYDQEYESICDTYFISPDAKFRTWLDDFHKFLIEEEIPFNEKMLRMQSAQYGFDPDISTVSLAAVQRYLEKSSGISGLRRPYRQGG